MPSIIRVRLPSPAPSKIMITSDIILNEWDKITTLVSYGNKLLTVGWYKNQAYIYIWNYRFNRIEWRRFPIKDNKEPIIKPPKWDPFNVDDTFYKNLNK